MTFREYKAKTFANDPALKAEYDAAAPQYDAIREEIVAKGRAEMQALLASPPPWDMLAKQLIWEQLGSVAGKRVLDFGSGEGITADHLAAQNDVTAIEPDAAMVAKYTPRHAFSQIIGDIEALRGMPDEAFDLVLCHNVLEYIEDKQSVLRELMRVLRPGGTLSLVKHNRYGRVMQMAVLLDDFDQAHALLDGGPGASQQFGAIRYYTQDELMGWVEGLILERTWGLRAFWHLQQNQEKHADPAWQEHMLALERRVGEVPEFRDVAMFHHCLLKQGGAICTQKN